VLDLTDLIDSPHGRWIFERALYSKAGPPPPDLPDTHDVVPVTQAILEVFGSGEDVRVFVDALPGLAAPWNVIDPADFSLDPADLGLALLDSVVAPALSSCEEASTSIAGALARSTGALTQVLAGPAGAGPELDAIFSWLQVRAGVASGDVVPLTALRLGLLVAAVPANVACQRALGAYPFSLGQAPAIPLPPSRSSQVRATNLEPEVEGFEPWTLTCMTVQVVAAAARLVCGWMNTVNDFKPLGLAGCDAPLFPAEGDARRTMSLFVAFETVSFVFNDCPVFRGCTMAEGWTASEEFFWWLQWIVQAMMILLDGVLVFFGHLVPESKRVVLALDGMMGARLRTTSSVVQLGLAGYTFGRSKGGRVDALRLLNRFAGCLPGMLGYLRYLVLDNLAGQPAPTKVLTGRPVVWLNAKVSTTIEADRIGPATRCWFVLSELLDPPSMPALTLPNGHLHQPYEQVSAFAPQGGTQPYSGWRVVHGRLPGGITLEPSEDGNTCVLAGTPKESGGFPFTLEVADHFAPEVTTKHTFSVYILSADEE